MSISDIIDILQNIDRKLNEVLPQVKSIDARLTKLECISSEVNEMKSSNISILSEVRGMAHYIGSVQNNIRASSDISDVSLQLSDQSDQGSNISGSEVDPGEFKAQKFGLVIADSDMTELAVDTGKLLNCQVSLFNYREGQLEPSLFDKQLEFVLIQDSGQTLDKYSQVTTEVVQEIKLHVQELVKFSMNILQIQPGTKVILGSLPPRYDGRVRGELARAFNGLLVTESFMEDRITVTTQSQLNCMTDKKLWERFESDKVTLTKYGNKLRVKNTAVQISVAVPQLKIVRKKYSNSNSRPHGPKHKQNLKWLLEELMQKI